MVDHRDREAIERTDRGSRPPRAQPHVASPASAARGTRRSVAATSPSHALGCWTRCERGRRGGNPVEHNRASPPPEKPLRGRDDPAKQGTRPSGWRYKGLAGHGALARRWAQRGAWIGIDAITPGPPRFTCTIGGPCGPPRCLRCSLPGGPGCLAGVADAQVVVGPDAGQIPGRHGGHASGLLDPGGLPIGAGLQKLGT